MSSDKTEPPEDPYEEPRPGENHLDQQRFGLVRYTLVRVALFLVVTGVLWLAGIRANTLILLALGLVISGLISIFVLSRTRDQASASIAGVFGRLNQRIEQSARAEDDLNTPDAPA